MARFTSLEEWAQNSAVPKRIRQALLWIVATESPVKSTAPTLAVLGMAGQHGLTKKELKKILGADISGVLSKLQADGAIERGTAGIFRLKAVSRLLGSPNRKKPDQIVFGPHSQLIGGSNREKSNESIDKASEGEQKGVVKNVDSLARMRTRTRRLADLTDANRASTTSDLYDQEESVARIRSERSERSIPHTTFLTGVEKRRMKQAAEQKKKRPGRPSYSANPSKRKTFREWQLRKPTNWDRDSCFGYWLHRYLETYGIEDPRYVGEPLKDQRSAAYGVMGFVRHERGLDGQVGQWKEYVDWLLDQFAPKADWLEKSLRLGQVIRLPNGKPNFFLAEWRESKARRFVKKKRKKTEYKHRPWGYEEVEVNE